MKPALYRATSAAALAAWLLGGCGPRLAEGPAVRVSESRRLMGAPWTITVHAASRAAGSEAIAAAFAEIERLERVLSDYDPESELSRLSLAAPTPGPVAVGADLWRVLVAAEGTRELTAGAFDIAVGPLTSLWRQARRSGRLPTADKLAAAKAAVGAGTVELVPETQSVRLPKPGTRLDPGGIGMGYAADRALEVLAARGIDSAMIDASGDVLVSAAPPGTTGWRIAVAPLRPGGEGETLVVSQAAITTSGDAHQAVEIEGVRYSHIVDPRTGLGVSGRTAVTVVAPDAMTADALATAASVLGHAAGPAVIESYPDCSARFAWREEGTDRVLTTPGWPGEPPRP
jgi:thiamine biosynthesis lipoprotein